MLLNLKKAPASAELRDLLRRACLRGGWPEVTRAEAAEVGYSLNS